MRCTSIRSAPNRRHATSQPLSEPRAARRRTGTEHRALAEARHGGTAAACECPGDPAPGRAIVVLVLYVHHTAQSIRVGALIGWVADATRDEVDRLYPAAPEPEDDPSVVAAPNSGVVAKLPHHVLVDIAEEADCVLELVPAMG